MGRRPINKTAMAGAERARRHRQRRRAERRRIRPLLTSASWEWHTPPHVVDMVREVLGEIELDPCWHPASYVTAPVTHIAEHDGLSRPWRGRTFVNPPYGLTIGRWTRKLAREHESGAVPEALLLIPARTDTKWFRELDQYPRCFVGSRLNFSGHRHPAPFPSAVVYMGRNVERFTGVFSRIGSVSARP